MIFSTRNESNDKIQEFMSWEQPLNSTGTSPSLRGSLRLDEPMSRHTTWRVGGTADQYFEPADREDLCTFLQQCPTSKPLLWIGLGSNLLVRDGGFRGAVIMLAKGLDNFEISADGIARVDAGVSCARFAKQSSMQSFKGAEFMAGIPGTIGGALAMNAGAHGASTWNLVRSVETVDRVGTIRRKMPEDFVVGYRSVTGLADEWFIAAEFRLQKDLQHAAQNRIDELLKHRSATQPVGQPNSGSVFKNPDKDFAARLIESSGLKGYQIGDARVSDKHANFIINNGAATAADIENLIMHIQETVYTQHKVKLVPEVRIVGERI